MPIRKNALWTDANTGVKFSAHFINEDMMAYARKWTFGPLSFSKIMITCWTVLDQASGMKEHSTHVLEQ